MARRVPFTGGEKQSLHVSLDRHRDAVLWKPCRPGVRERAWRPARPSRTDPGGPPSRRAPGKGKL